MLPSSPLRFKLPPILCPACKKPIELRHGMRNFNIEGRSYYPCISVAFYVFSLRCPHHKGCLRVRSLRGGYYLANRHHPDFPAYIAEHLEKAIFNGDDPGAMIPETFATFIKKDEADAPAQHVPVVPRPVPHRTRAHRL